MQVKVGDISLGGDSPIRIQSMTNTDTMDTVGTVDQCIRIIKAGGDFVRITVPSVKEAENLRDIKKLLKTKGFGNPLIADIHFNPSVAEAAARIVEKVRINPGNYVDKRASFTTTELSEHEYKGELERIHQRLLPLIKICKEYGTAIRVGINQGSLSDRVMSRYGNTPEAMVASANEFVEIFQAENFHNLVLSMKSSDTGVVVRATRLLAKKMRERGVVYPLHLGVTEAGEGDDGRIRSATGIATLLLEGIGDTIRVSLSEPPENEIPVARQIVDVVAAVRGENSKAMEALEYREHNELYRPVVVTCENGRLLLESGEEYRGNIIEVDEHSMQVHYSQEELRGSLLKVNLSEDDRETVAVKAASLAGRFFISKQASGICVCNNGEVQGEALRDTAFAILQATEARITGNRYISCPTCGRTKYDLPSAVKRVKEATKHLSGLKIAIMGCVVNGPGEMVGADFGYVGAAPGRVNIYRGMDVIARNVTEKEAIETLLKVINDSTNSEEGH